MSEHIDFLKEKLMTLIDEMAASRQKYVKNPGKDFTRERKLPFGDVVKLLISMGGNNIYKELLDFKGMMQPVSLLPHLFNKGTKYCRLLLSFCYMNLTR